MKIKIYGTELNNPKKPSTCSMCKTLDFFRDKVTLDTEYIAVTTDEQKEELNKKYNVLGFPVVLVDGKLTTFNDCMDLFKKNRK